MGTARQLSVDSNKPSSQHLQQLQQQLQQIDDNWVELRDKRFSANSSSASISNRQSFKCDAVAAADKVSASGDSKNSNSINATTTITQTSSSLSSSSTTTANISNTTAGSSTSSTNTNNNNNNSNITANNNTNQDCVGVEESCLLGIDCNERTTIGLVVPILADTTIHLDGDG